MCAEDPRDGLGDGSRYFERRGFGSTSRGVVSPDLGRMDPTDVARDWANDGSRDNDTRDSLGALLCGGFELNSDGSGLASLG